MSSTAYPPPTDLDLAFARSAQQGVAFLAGLAGSATTLPLDRIAADLAQLGSKAWEGKAVVVTGAASGIGRELASQLGAMGATLVLGDLEQQQDKLSEVKTEVEESGGSCTTAAVDVAEWKQQQAFFDLAIKEYGKIDAVFANAGISQEYAAVGKGATADELARHHFSKNMENTDKLLVFTGSLGSYGAAANSMYYTAKHGALGLARSLTSPLAPENVSVLFLAPNFTATPLIPQSWLDAYAQAGVFVSDAKDVAAGAVWAASQSEKSKTGKTLLWDASGVTIIPLHMTEWTGKSLLAGAA
ncbi:hypothetical protein JCM10207_004015 [Rhodosporidiobolus poonsookiae]